MEDRLIKKMTVYSEGFHSPGYLMMEMRYLSGEISEHVAVTKDKYGEVSLNVLLVKEAVSRNFSNIDNATYGKAYKLCAYIVNKLFKIVIQIKSMHEDLHSDFKPMLFEIGNAMGQCDHLMNTAIRAGFDANWLMTGDIPEDIKEHYQNVKAMGLLK